MQQNNNKLFCIIIISIYINGLFYCNGIRILFYAVLRLLFFQETQTSFHFSHIQ